MARTNSLIVLFVAVLAVSALPYKKESGVIELTKKTFADQIIGTEHVSIVEFYAPCELFTSITVWLALILTLFQGVSRSD